VRPAALDAFLKKAHVPFTVLRYPAAFTAQHEAAASHTPGRLWAKTVVCMADEEPVLAVVPAHFIVDLERLRALAKAMTVRLARENELADLWPECEPGATSPFLTRRCLRVFVDRGLVGEPELVISAGTHTDAVRMHFGDFAELTQPVIGSIGQMRR